MEWYCCNGCFVKANKDAYFFITTCLHIYCERCVNTKCFDRCFVCKEGCSFFKINSTLRPEAKKFFADLSTLASNLDKEIQEFTLLKQQEALAFSKRKIAELKQIIQFQWEQTNTFFKKSNFDPQKIESLVQQITELNEQVSRYKNENQELKNRITGYEQTNFSIKPRIFDGNEINPMFGNTEPIQFGRDFGRDENQNSGLSYMLNQQPSAEISNKKEVNSTNIILINQHSNQQAQTNHQMESNFGIPRSSQSVYDSNQMNTRKNSLNHQCVNSILLNESKFLYTTPCNPRKKSEDSLLKNHVVSSGVSRSTLSPGNLSQSSIRGSAQPVRQIQLPAPAKPISIRNHLIELRQKR